MSNKVRRRHHPYGERLWGPDFANQQAMAETSTAAQSQLALGEFYAGNEDAGHVMKELSWRNSSGTSARVFIGGLLPDAAWNAGQHDESANSYVDNTTLAQSAATNDFNLYPAGAAAGDGFIVHADRPFTAISILVHTTHAGVGPHTVEYLDGGTFVAVPSILVQPTLVGDTAEDQIVVWSKPPSWDVSAPGVPSGIATGRYVVRIRFTGNVPTGKASQLRVGNWRWTALLLPTGASLQGSSMDVAITSGDERPWALFDNGPVANHQVAMVTELAGEAQKLGS